MSEMLWVLIVAALTIVPMFKILPHFGINRLWAFACIIPIGTIALLWWVGIKIQELEKR